MREMRALSPTIAHGCAGGLLGMIFSIIVDPIVALTYQWRSPYSEERLSPTRRSGRCTKNRTSITGDEMTEDEKTRLDEIIRKLPYYIEKIKPIASSRDTYALMAGEMSYMLESVHSEGDVGDFVMHIMAIAARHKLDVR